MRLRLFVAAMCLGIFGSVVANPAHERLMQLNENQRQQLLSSYMQKSGEQCAVTRTFYQGATDNGDVIWNVQCKGGEAFAILIKNDASGSSTILECDLLKKIKAGDCFKKFK